MKLTFKHFKVFGSKFCPFRFCHTSLKTVNVDVSVLAVMITLSERTMHASEVPAEEHGDQHIQNIALEGFAPPLFNKWNTDMTIKIAPPVTIAGGHEWPLHLEIHAKDSKEEAFKIRSHWWNVGLNSRVILLVGISQGPQDAASLKGKMLPISCSGVSQPHTRPGLLAMAATLDLGGTKELQNKSSHRCLSQIAMTPHLLCAIQNLALFSGICGLTFQGTDFLEQHWNSKMPSSSCNLATWDCDYLVQCHAVTPGVTPKPCWNVHASVNPTDVRR